MKDGLGGGTVKILLNLLNVALLVFFCLALHTGIKLEHDFSGLGSHLGWILGAMLTWLFVTILSLMYMYRMEKFCVEMADKLERGETPARKPEAKIS